MSRKDYVRFAETLSAEWSMADGMPGEHSIRRTVWRLTLSQADIMAQDNPAFDRERFYRAVFGCDQWDAQASIDYDRV